MNLGGSIDNVVVLAGMGNNGGDGWVAAEALRSRNVNVKVITPIEPDQISGDLARQMAQRAVRSGVSVLVGPPKTELAFNNRCRFGLYVGNRLSRKSPRSL